MSDQNKKALLIAVATTIMGQVYLTPFNTEFRLSLGITMMTFLLISLGDAPIRRTGLYTMLSVVVFRTTLDLFQLTIVDLSKLIAILNTHYPAGIFYFLCAVILHQISIRSYRNRPVYFILLVSMIDVFSNIMEVLIRRELTRVLIEPVVSRLILTGLVRATLAYLLIVAFRAMNMLILREEHQQRYSQLLFFTANMKSELFFLNKSMHDIESAMASTFKLYKDLQGTQKLVEQDVTRVRKQLLSLSNDIHEIKKDHQRATLGLQKLLPNPDESAGMKLSNLGKLLEDNTKHLVSQLGKDIQIHIRLNSSIKINSFYPLLTVLNNMLMNSIEAMAAGQLKVTMLLPDPLDETMVQFIVKDNGPGIPEEDLPHVFTPGFSTKFSEVTGQMSQGIGLAHAKSLIEEYYDGSIDVTSTPLTGTLFTIRLNREILEKGREIDAAENLYH